MFTSGTYTKSSKYKYVYLLHEKQKDNKQWLAKITINKESIYTRCNTETEAAIVVDLFKIKHKKKPINKLKKI